MRSSFGCVQRLGADRYRLRWWADTPEGYRRVTETVRGTRREAERRMAEIRAGADEQAERAARGVPTVGEAFERWWLPDATERLQRGEVARGTYDGRMGNWRRHVAPRWADVPVDRVRALDVQGWLLGMTQSPANGSLAVLRQVLDYCTLYDIVPDNVARRRYKLPTAHRDMKDGAYTLAELDRIAQAARGSACEAAMLLCMFGSARTGESLAVRLDEVTREGYEGVALTVAQVVRQLFADGTVGEDGRLKTPQSVRPLVIPPPWGDRLWELAEDARAAGDTWLCDDGLGRPSSRGVYAREWREACEAAGVEPRQARAARRSWETYMRWDWEVDRSKVEQMMGHLLPGVTGAHYDKPTANEFVRAVGRAAKLHPFVREVPGT